MMEDQLILVDIFDNEVGTEAKMKAHEKGLLHRAFSVFLYDGEKMLVQKRQTGKYHSGGLWTNACCSHPRQGEALEDAVERRLQEELGVRAETEEIHSFVYRAVFPDGLSEYEYDHVFLGRYQGGVKEDPEEVSEVRWAALSELAEDLKNHPEKYCAWFLIAAPKVIQEIRRRTNGAE